jgi:maleamate amidohydrolase
MCAGHSTVDLEFLNRFRTQYQGDPAPRLGPGARPAVLVVDFVRGWTDGASPLAADLDDEVAATAELLRARRLDVPAIFTTVEYEPGEELTNVLCRKAPRVSCLRPRSPWIEIDRRLPRRENDLVIAKKFASAFFGTSLAALLGDRGIDTLFICGCVTSGCVRASAVDAAQYGLRALVVREAVGDRSPLAHAANLIDIDQRYGDVIGLAEALQFIS